MGDRVYAAERIMKKRVRRVSIAFSSLFYYSPQKDLKITNCK